jgi:hypothetical protein
MAEKVKKPQERDYLDQIIQNAKHKTNNSNPSITEVLHSYDEIMSNPNILSFIPTREVKSEPHLSIRSEHLQKAPPTLPSAK